MEEVKSTLSQRGQQLVFGGAAIILVWFVVNYVPSTVAFLTKTEAGKVILFWIQLGLFGASIFALIVICAIVGPSKNFKISKFRLGSAEITFKKDEINGPAE